MSEIHPYLETLTAICNLPTAPFHERHVARWLPAWAAMPARSAFIASRRDAAGNVYLSYDPRLADHATAPPQLVIEAHMDHPGFVADSADERGNLTARFYGGVRPSCFAGAVATFFVPDDQDAKPDPAAAPPDHHGSARVPPSPKGSWIPAAIERVDAGEMFEPMRVTFAPDVRVVPKGTLGMWNLPEARAEDGIFKARTCDDACGVAAALCMLDELIAARVDARVLVLLTRAEEVGFAGVLAVARNGWIDPRCPVLGLETSKASAEATLGAGPVIRAGDRANIFSPPLTAFIAQRAQAIAATDSAFRHQRRLMDGGTCNTSAFLMHGYDAAGICLALGNYHNMIDPAATPDAAASSAGPHLGSEFINLEDFAMEVRLLVETAAKIGDYTGDLSSQRKTWQRIHDKHQRERLLRSAE